MSNFWGALHSAEDAKNNQNSEMKEQKIVYEVMTKDIVFRKPKNDFEWKGKYSGTGKAMTRKKYTQQINAGKTAEELVEKFLKDTAEEKGRSDILRRSGTSYNIIGDDSAHYDISYKKDGKIFYVEVKSCSNGSFHISAAEYAFAEKNKENYCLALVCDGKIKIVENVVEKINQSRIPTDWLINFEFK